MRGGFDDPESVLGALSGADAVRSSLVKLGNLSQTGIIFECGASLSIGLKVRIELPCVLSKCAVIVWRDGRCCACDFLVPLRFQDVTRCFVAYTKIVVIG